MSDPLEAQLAHILREEVRIAEMPEENRRSLFSMPASATVATPPQEEEEDARFAQALAASLQPASGTSGNHEDERLQAALAASRQT